MSKENLYLESRDGEAYRSGLKTVAASEQSTQSGEVDTMIRTVTVVFVMGVAWLSILQEGARA